ncbi:hypothetical protein GYH30_008480 [Glycine max]|nr:hypothetical protein GYH30_008480 [Glycine max]
MEPYQTVIEVRHGGRMLIHDVLISVNCIMELETHKRQ